LTLHLTLNFVPVVGQPITLVNDVGSPITGAFTGWRRA